MSRIRTKILFLLVVLSSSTGHMALAESPMPTNSKIEAAEQPLRKKQKQEMRSEGLISSLVRFLRSNGRMEELEKFYQDIRRTRARTHSGEWQLSVFYKALSDDVPKMGGSKLHKVYRKAWLKFGEEWRLKFPKSPAAHIGHASQLLNDAWQIRGSGFVQEVWPDDLRNFSQKIEEAAAALEDCRDFASADPHWYSLRIIIAKARSEGFLKISGLLSEVVEKEPYYYGNYFQALYAAQPRWGGSWKLIENLIDWSVEKTKDKDGTSMFAHMYVKLYGLEPILTEKLKDNENFWPRMKKSISDKLKSYPYPDNLGSHLLYTCRAKNALAVQWLLEKRKRLGGLTMAYANTDPASVCGWKKAREQPGKNPDSQPFQRAKSDTNGMAVPQ